MNKQLYLCAALLGMVFTAANVEAKPAPNTKQRNALEFYSAYNFYKVGNVDATIATMTGLGFNLDRSVQSKIAPDGQIDSLVFSAEEGTKAIFHSIDLKYVKNVEVNFQVMSDKGASVINELTAILTNDGLKLTPDMHRDGLFSIFEDDREVSVIDSRWEEWTITSFISLYNHQMSNYESYYVVMFSEIVPELIGLSEELFIGSVSPSTQLDITVRR